MPDEVLLILVGAAAGAMVMAALTTEVDWTRRRIEGYQIEQRWRETHRPDPPPPPPPVPPKKIVITLVDPS